MAEKKYIEIEYVLKCMEDSYKNAGISAEAKAKMTRWLNKAPAADVRPVVFCRDCKHRFMKPNGWHCPYAEWGIEDDDFCSCGEKREES